MIVAVAATKGGVGKTTIAINLAINLARRGRSVGLLDADAQKTATQALIRQGLSSSAGAAIEPPVLLSTESGEDLMRVAVEAGRRFDEFIIDVGGKDGQSLRSAVLVADLVLTPFQPRSFDVWGLEDMSQILSEASRLRESTIPWCGVLNLADPTGVDNDEASRIAAGFDALQVAPCRLQRRKQFSAAAAAGGAVGERGFRDAAARAELDRLVEYIFIASSNEATMGGE